MKNRWIVNTKATMSKIVTFFLLIAGIALFGRCHEKLTSYSKERNTVSKERNTVTKYDHTNDSTLTLTGISADQDFGKSEKKPIMLGLIEVRDGADNVKKYLNALQGPQGESITYTRLKPCCPFKTKNFMYTSPFLVKPIDEKYGMLEKYSIRYTDQSGEHITELFFNLYDQTTTVLAPYGLSYRK